MCECKYVCLHVQVSMGVCAYVCAKAHALVCVCVIACMRVCVVSITTRIQVYCMDLACERCAMAPTRTAGRSSLCPC